MRARSSVSGSDSIASSVAPWVGGGATCHVAPRACAVSGSVISTSCAAMSSGLIAEPREARKAAIRSPSGPP